MFSSLEFRLELGPIEDGDLLAARWTGVGRTDDGEMPLLGNDILRVATGASPSTGWRRGRGRHE